MRFVKIICCLCIDNVECGYCIHKLYITVKCNVIKSQISKTLCKTISQQKKTKLSKYFHEQL